MKLGDLMNPEQYALEVLDMFLHKQCDLERTKFAYEQTEVWNSVKMARDALEKQIPKKVIYKPEKAVYQIPHCPNCDGELYDENFRIGYCECGQAIMEQWGEEE